MKMLETESNIPKLMFSDYFGIPATKLEKAGVLDICLTADLPLFIDPFLLFASEKPIYQKLHKNIIDHILELKRIATEDRNPDLRMFCFPEIEHNWLGFCYMGNKGRGLGKKFAQNLINEFKTYYKTFGQEEITESSHIEKLTLMSPGTGRDFISDFTANLTHEYLLEFTQKFCKANIPNEKRKIFSIRCHYNSELKIFEPREFDLPYFYDKKNGEHIILSPIDILTKDEAFISGGDLFGSFRRVTSSIPADSLREKINDYFQNKLPPRPKPRDVSKAITDTLHFFPEIMDYYIKRKEDERENAPRISLEKITEIKTELIQPLLDLLKIICKDSKPAITTTIPNTYKEALDRALFLKDVIENNDGYRVFYHKNKPIAKEDMIQRIFRLTWFASLADVNSEVNNGRGPADYKISFGGRESTIVEFKLARSSSLARNMKNQVAIYKKANKSINDISVILCYTKFEITKVLKLLKSEKLDNPIPENIVIIDASPKLSASKV